MWVDGKIETQRDCKFLSFLFCNVHSVVMLYFRMYGDTHFMCLCLLKIFHWARKKIFTFVLGVWRPVAVPSDFYFISPAETFK